MPVGYARRLRNQVQNDGEWQQRHPLTYDGLIRALGLATWYDELSETARLIAALDDVVTPGANVTFKVKNVSDEGYADAAPFLTGSGIADFANLRGTVYMAMRWVGTNYIPCKFINNTDEHVFSFNSPLASLGVNALDSFIERLFFGGLDLSIFNYVLNDGVTYTYDPAAWTLTTVSASATVRDGATTFSITPTNATGSALQHVIGSSTFVSEQKLTWRLELQPTSATYEMPFTAQLTFVAPWEPSTDYAEDDLVTSIGLNGVIFKCTTAGTSDVAEPAWVTTLGSTTADATVVWTAMRSDVLGSQEFYLPTTTTTKDFTYYTIQAEMPTYPETTFGTVRLLLKFGNEATPSITLSTVNFGFTDGLDEDDPIKANHGQQLTLSHFDFPFVNIETVGVQPRIVRKRDYIYWTEVQQPSEISAENYYRLQSIPGPITVIREFNEQLHVFKRGSFWRFVTTEDPNIPILPTGGARVGVGLPNPKALDIGPDGYMYGIGENFPWRMRPGGEPEDIAGDGMRAEIMARGANWCESQAAPANRALCSVNHREKRAYFYTQKGRWFTYEIDSGAWAQHDAGGNADTLSGYEICDMIYSPTTGNTYAAFVNAATGVAGLARLDETVTNTEDSISDSGTLPIYSEVIPRPIELVMPTYELALDDVWFHHTVTADQSGQDTFLYRSENQGVTWSLLPGMPFEIETTGGNAEHFKVDIYRSGATQMLRLLHVGKGGEENFSISRMLANVRLIGGEYPKKVI